MKQKELRINDSQLQYFKEVEKVMGKDYGSYHDEIWDLQEFIQGIADVRLKYIADNELAKILETAINILDKAKWSLIKKSEIEVESKLRVLIT